jgi:hypothetical protein
MTERRVKADTERSCEKGCWVSIDGMVRSGKARVLGVTYKYKGPRHVEEFEREVIDEE